MLRIFRNVPEIIGFIYMLMLIVEREGNGEEKKAKVIEKAREWIEEARNNISPFIYRMLMDGPALGAIIDFIAWVAHDLGIFRKEEE